MTLTHFLWDYAIEAADYLLNMIPIKSGHTNPYKLCARRRWSLELKGLGWMECQHIQANVPSW